MARPEKTGLGYYSVDTDLFSNRKIRRLLKDSGANGYAIYSYILTEIYRDKGCFIHWDDDTAFDISDILRLEEDLVNEVVKYCCKIGLFNQDVFINKSILTSKNIQEFWVNVSKKANRKITKVLVEINLVIEEIIPKKEDNSPKKENPPKKELITPNKEESTPSQELTTPTKEESKQSKVKKSKVKESKEDDDETPASNSLISIENLADKYLNNSRLCSAIIKNHENKINNQAVLKIRIWEFIKELEQRSVFNKTEADFNNHFKSWHLKTVKSTSNINKSIPIG